MTADASPAVFAFSVRTKLNYNPPKEDGSTYRIELQGVSMSIMKQILDYIFSGEVSEGPLNSGFKLKFTVGPRRTMLILIEKSSFSYLQ